MQYISGRRISQDFGIPDLTTNDTVVNVDGRIAVGIGESATANIDTNSIRIREDILDFDGFSGEFGYFLSKDVDGLKWVAVTPIQSNSIFISENSDFVGVSSFTGFNIISDQLLGISTNPDNSTIADIRIDPRWFRDRTPGGGGGIYTTGTVGIGLTQPRLGSVGVLTDVKLDVLGDAIFSGVVSARSFVGEFDIDTQNLNVSGLATFRGEDDNTLGDPNTGAVQIDGGVGINKNVSIGASLFVNTLVGIGTSTNLDDNALTVNGGNVDILGDDTTVKIGTAVTIGNGIVSATTGDFTNLQLDNLDVSGIATINSGIITNLDVTGLSTFGNTARFDSAVNIFDDLFVSGNISVGGTGVTLDTETIRVEGKELLIGFTTTITSNDTTANAGGIAVASTEGYFLADLQLGVNTTPNTYKQFKWFKNETFAGQGTDAFISNQPISIGNTQIGNGVVFSAGNLNVKSDESTLGDVKISSGIITAIAGAAVTVYGDLIGTASTASFATTAFNLDSPETLSVGFATTATNVIGGIASVTSLSVNTSGISTLGTVQISAGIVTSTTGTAVTYFGNLIGTASTASFATTAFNLEGAANLSVGFAQTAGIATYTSEWNITANGNSDYRFTGPGFTGSENDPTIYLTRGEQYKFTNNLGAHPFQIQRQFQNTGGTAYNDGIVNNGVSNGTLTWNVRMDAPDILYYQCTSHTNMSGKIYIVNAGIASDVNLFTTGIATIGTVKISAGIVTHKDNIGSGITFFGNLTGTASTASFATTAFNLDSPETLSVGFATTSTNVIGGIASVTSLSVNTSGISTLGVVEINAGIITASEPSGIITYFGELGLGVSIASSIRDSSGSFGSNGQVLAVTSSGLAYTTFTADASSVTVEDITSGTYYVGAWENTGSQPKAYVETTNPVVITSDGRIGIGSTDPTAKLDVDGGVIVSGVVTATDFNSTSDARLKTNIKVIDNPTEKVLRIDGVSFNWIKDNKSSIGVIADNIKEVLPQLVSDTNPKTVNYNGLVGLLIEVVKEQQSQIESLSERISRLE